MQRVMSEQAGICTARVRSADPKGGAGNPALTGGVFGGTEMGATSTSDGWTGGPPCPGLGEKLRERRGRHPAKYTLKEAKDAGSLSWVTMTSPREPLVGRLLWDLAF